MHKNSYRFAAALALGWSSIAGAQGVYIVPGADDRSTRVGTRGANFLEIGTGARAEGMGNAAMATVDGPSALFWNAANIVGGEGISAFASYMRLFGASGITHTAASITAPVGAGTVGLGVVSFSSGEMDRTTEIAPDGNDPTFPGTFSYSGLSLSAHYARPVTDRLSAAFGVRYTDEGIDFSRSSYVGVDLSTRFRTGLYGLSMGAGIQNIGSASSFRGTGIERVNAVARNTGLGTGRVLTQEFETRQISLPATVRFGLQESVLGDAESIFGGTSEQSLMLEYDATKAIDTDLRALFGAEYGFKKIVFLRAGKQFWNEQNSPWKFADGLSFGGGFRAPFAGRRVSLDYAWVKMGELQNNQVISFEVGY
jgi:hypothetical protein